VMFVGFCGVCVSFFVFFFFFFCVMLNFIYSYSEYAKE